MSEDVFDFPELRFDLNNSTIEEFLKTVYPHYNLPSTPFTPSAKYVKSAYNLVIFHFLFIPVLFGILWVFAYFHLLSFYRYLLSILFLVAFQLLVGIAVNRRLKEELARYKLGRMETQVRVIVQESYSLRHLSAYALIICLMTFIPGFLFFSFKMSWLLIAWPLILMPLFFLGPHSNATIPRLFSKVFIPKISVQGYRKEHSFYLVPSSLIFSKINNRVSDIIFVSVGFLHYLVAESYED